MSPMLTERSSCARLLVSWTHLDSTPVWGLCLGYALQLGMFFPHMAVRLASSHYRSSLQGSPTPSNTSLLGSCPLSRSAGRVSPSALRSCTFEGPVHHPHCVLCLCLLTLEMQRWHLVFTQRTNSSLHKKVLLLPSLFHKKWQAWGQ